MNNKNSILSIFSTQSIIFLSIIQFLLIEIIKADDSISPIEFYLNYDNIYVDSQNLQLSLNVNIKEGWKIKNINEYNLAKLKIKSNDIIKSSVHLLENQKKNSNISIQIFIKPKNYKEVNNIHLYAKYIACNDICIPYSWSWNGYLKNSMIHTTKSKITNLLESEEMENQAISQLIFITIIAFIGGFLLNFMPCVLPILSLKIFEIVKSVDLSKKDIIKHMLSNAIGIITAFSSLSMVIIYTKYISNLEFNLQDSVFLIFLIYILLFFSLTMLDKLQLQDLNFPIYTNNVHKISYFYSFFSGIISVIFANSCTAPLIGTSIAFAMSGSWQMIIILYLAMGIGMSMPFIIIAINPKLLSLLPKPGPWIDRVKKTSGVLLLLTVAWLLYIISYQISNKAFLILLGSLMILKFILQLNVKYYLKLIMIVGVFLLPMKMNSKDLKLVSQKENSNWKNFSYQTLKNHIQNNQIVFVDITAEWCITCKFNKFFVLDRKDVQELFIKNNVVMLRGDYTNRNKEIADYLKDNNAYGVPFNVVYGNISEENSIILPTIITKASIIEAISKFNSVKK